MTALQEGMEKARIIGVETAIEVAEIAIKYGQDPIAQMKDYLRELQGIKK